MRALIVEDSKLLSFAWSEALSDIGFESDVAHAARDAMAHALAKRYDVFILDLFVTDGNTIPLSDWLRMRSPDVPMIMITGSGELPAGEHTKIASSVDWLLRKPIRISELQHMVEHLTRTRAAANQPISGKAFHQA